jgi:hypothetical protein
MSIDNAIRAIAFSEAPTLAGAVALIAKHRQDLDNALRAAELTQMPVTAEGAAVERALDDVEPAPPPSGHAVDKTA